MAKDQKIALGTTLVVLGFLLLMRPDCKRGCRTVAQHLVEHGLEDLIAGLFG